MSTPLNQWTAATTPTSGQGTIPGDGTVVLPSGSTEVRRNYSGIDLTQGPLVLRIRNFQRTTQSTEAYLKVGFNVGSAYGEFKISRQNIAIVGWFASSGQLSFTSGLDPTKEYFRFSPDVGANAMLIEQGAGAAGPWTALANSTYYTGVPAGNFFPGASAADFQNATAYVDLDGLSNANDGSALDQVFGPWVTSGVAPTGLALGCGAAVTLIDGQTLALAPSVTPAGAPQGVDYTISPPAGSISGGNVYTPPAQQPTAQTVTITAKPAGQASPSAQVVVTIPSNTPTIRILDGVTPVANGAVVPVMRQAATAPFTRYVYVDNGSGPVSGGDNALTGLSVSVNPAAAWLAAALNQTTAGAVLSLGVTSPSTVPGTPDPDVTVTVASSVPGVASRAFVVPGAVAAASTSGFTLAQIAQMNRLEQMLLPVGSALGNLSALGGTTQDKFNQVLAAQAQIPAGQTVATQQGVAAKIDAGVTLTTGERTAVRSGLSTLGTSDLGTVRDQITGHVDTALDEMDVSGDVTLSDAQQTALATKLLAKQQQTQAFTRAGTVYRTDVVAVTKADGTDGHEVYGLARDGTVVTRSNVLDGPPPVPVGGS